MNALLPLIEQALINGFMSKKAPFMRKNKLGLGLMALSGLLFCSGVIFAMIAGYGWLLTQFAQPIAALISAGFICGFAMFSLLCGIFMARKKQPPAMQSDEITEIMNLVTDVIGEDLAEPIIANPKTSVLLASAAGFVVGDRLN